MRGCSASDGVGRHPRRGSLRSELFCRRERRLSHDRACRGGSLCKQQKQRGRNHRVQCYRRGSLFAQTGVTMSLKNILDQAQQDVVREERRILNDLRTSLIRFGASDENMAPLERSIEGLDELFLLVVVGEFNAGKSAFINALTGERRMEEGVTPTTARVTPVRYEDINIVDTPGTNAVIREHEEITAQYVPRADLVLFVTSADRPFTETERAFLEQIRDWGKKIVVVINKIDILTGDKELGEVRAYVADNARRLLGVTPEIFPVSAKAAFRAKNGEPQLWASSGFEGLERDIRSTLDAAARTQL